MPPPIDLARAIAARQDGLVTTRQAQRVGLTYGDVRAFRRRGEWHPLTRGVNLLDAELFVDGVPERAWWRAALLAHGAEFALVGPTAAEALGMAGLPQHRDEIEVGWVGGRSRHPRAADTTTLAFGGVQRRVVVRQLDLAFEDIVVVDGFRVSAPARTVIDAALRVDRPTGLALMDSALHQELISTRELADAITAATGRRGIVTVRKLSWVADGRAESPLESRVRLACIDGDVPPDELQYDVLDATGFVVARGDLAWLKRRRPLLGEADGESVHGLPPAVYRDRRRGNALAAEACDTLRFTYADTFQRGYIPWAVKNALRAA